MTQMSAFEFFLRTGRRLNLESQPIATKFNPWHDPDDGRFTFANQGRYFPRRTGSASSSTAANRGPLRGVSPVEKQRAAQINRFVAEQNAKTRVPISETITLQLEKRGASVSGRFTRAGRPGSVRFIGNIARVPGKQEIRIVGLKWNASIGRVRSFPDTLRVYSNSSGLFAQMNRDLHVTFGAFATVHEKAIPQRLNRLVK